jgi:hypothetical protein
MMQQPSYILEKPAVSHNLNRVASPLVERLNPKQDRTWCAN